MLKENMTPSCFEKSAMKYHSLFIICGLLVACSHQEPTGLPTKTENIKVYPTTSCFASREGNQVTAIQITITGSDVQGFFAWEQPGAVEQYHGSFVGKKEGEQILADFTYLLNDKKKMEEVLFRLTPGRLLQARGELIPVNGKMVFRDKKDVLWAMLYDAVDCGKIASEIERSKKVAAAW